jgi:hypothetical protein
MLLHSQKTYDSDNNADNLPDIRDLFNTSPSPTPTPKKAQTKVVHVDSPEPKKMKGKGKRAVHAIEADPPPKLQKGPRLTLTAQRAGTVDTSPAASSRDTNTRLTRARSAAISVSDSETSGRKVAEVDDDNGGKDEEGGESESDGDSDSTITGAVREINAGLSGY